MTSSGVICWFDFVFYIVSNVNSFYHYSPKRANIASLFVYHKVANDQSQKTDLVCEPMVAPWRHRRPFAYSKCNLCTLATALETYVVLRNNLGTVQGHWLSNISDMKWRHQCRWRHMAASKFNISAYWETIYCQIEGVSLKIFKMSN